MNAQSSKHSRRTHRVRERGLAMVEFAICIPVLLFLMLATAETGRLLFQYNTLAKAVRDGARYAATNAAVGTTRVVDITAATRNEARNLVVTGTTVGTGAPLVPGLTVDNVEVNDVGNGFISVSIVNYNYAPALGTMLPTFGLGARINLRVALPVTVVMRAL
jgi:Flp pilus assembly protein TadG